jgi:60S ribosomal protein uL30
VQIIPESVLKKRKSLAAIAAGRKERLKSLRSKKQQTRKFHFKRAEKYVKEYRSLEKQKVFLHRQAKSNANFYKEPEAKLAFVIRIRGINGLAPKPRKILQLLRLRQINAGVFVRLTKATLNMLKLIEPYITWGVPNLKTVKELLYKRGFAKVNKQRLPISDNALVEKQLGHCNVLCLEDIVHEIVTVGDHFRQVNKFLWPFKLPNPRGGWRGKNTHFNEGGDCGYRGEKLNELIHRMV